MDSLIQRFSLSQSPQVVDHQLVPAGGAGGVGILDHDADAPPAELDHCRMALQQVDPGERRSSP
jgi:hypothetical protein